MKEVYLLTIGKLKDKSLSQIEEDYLKRLNSFKLKTIELKSLQEDKDAGAISVLKKCKELSIDQIILLTEHTEVKDSPKFSKWFFNLLENSNKLALIIAGAAGPGKELIKASNHKLSLSPLTFPHQLARLILVEQLYRAQTIYQGHPYHK